MISQLSAASLVSNSIQGSLSPNLRRLNHTTAPLPSLAYYLSLDGVRLALILCAEATAMAKPRLLAADISVLKEKRQLLLTKTVWKCLNE